MLDIGRMYQLIAEGELVVWELRRESELLGTLTAYSRLDMPWFSAKFIPFQDFENYKHLFDEYNHVPIVAGQTPGGLYVASGINRKMEIGKQIAALGFSLFPLNENALPGSLEEIVIYDDMEAQLIVDFEEPNELEG